MIKILGIDPSCTNLGWSIVEYDESTDTCNVLTYGQISAHAKAKKEYRSEFKDFSEVVVLLSLENQLREVLTTHTPDYVVSESAFMHRFPKAFVSLSLCISTIRRVLYQDYHQTLYTVAPMEAKKAVGAKNNTKDAVKDAIVSLTDLIIPDHESLPLVDITEHESDSIAIAYTFIRKVLPTLK